jgi:hypothetical protein
MHIVDRCIYRVHILDLLIYYIYNKMSLRDKAADILLTIPIIQNAVGGSVAPTLYCMELSSEVNPSQPNDIILDMDLDDMGILDKDGAAYKKGDFSSGKSIIKITYDQTNNTITQGMIGGSDRRWHDTGGGVLTWVSSFPSWTGGNGLNLLKTKFIVQARIFLTPAHDALEVFVKSNMTSGGSSGVEKVRHELGIAIPPNLTQAEETRIIMEMVYGSLSKCMGDLARITTITYPDQAACLADGGTKLPSGLTGGTTSSGGSSSAPPPTPTPTLTPPRTKVLNIQFILIFIVFIIGLFLISKPSRRYGGDTMVTFNKVVR